MKKIITLIISALLVISFGFELTSFSQCVSEENVYSFNFMGKKYEVVKELKTWSEAALCAVERGGYLAEINSQDEQDTIYGAIVFGAEIQSDYTVVADGGGIAYVWIGASDQHNEGTWLWDGDGDSIGINFWNGQGYNGTNDGVPVDELFNNWGGSVTGTPNEPDDFLSNQDGAAIGLAKWPAGIDFELGVASEWNDISADNSIYFVIEFDCKDTFTTIDEIACGSYISPTGKTWVTSDTYLDTVMNAAGCDSVITINLTVVTVDTSVVRNDKTLSASAAGLEYQWLDCDQGYSIITGETNQSFTAASNGNYAVEITDGSCSDTSECFAITTVQAIEKSFIEQVNIYQSTDRNIFSVDLGKEYQEIFLKVVDVYGRIVKNRTFIQSQLLNMELDKPPGIYLFTINVGTQQAVIKILKN